MNYKGEGIKWVGIGEYANRPSANLSSSGRWSFDRIAIEAKPGLEIIGCYVLTRGAERALQAIDRRLNESRGGLFWIGGPAGSGKTHFLNYLLALDRSHPDERPRRHLALALEGAGRGRSETLEARIRDGLARALGINSRDAMLWRQMPVAEALTVALDHARRLGTAAITVGIDFDVAESDAAGDYLATIGRACESAHPKLIVIAAGRGKAPSSASAFEVAPVDNNELATVAIGRARRLKDEAKVAVEEFCRAVDTGSFNPCAIFPFHPLSIDVLRAIANAPGSIAELARLVRDVLAPDGEPHVFAHRGLIVPADLFASPAVCARVEARLGESGRAALKIARAALEKMNGEDGKLAKQILETLVLARVGGSSPELTVAELQARLPGHWSGALAPADTVARINALLSRLAERSANVIRFESKAAHFDPGGAGAPQVASFNAALPLISRFDPTITPARELPELKAKLKRLADAMSNAIEAAHRTGEVLAPVLREAQGRVALERQSTLADYVALASSGPTALIEAAADSKRRQQALETIAGYETMSGAATAAPRLWAMRDYLQATGLRWSYDDRDRDGRISALESECQLLGSQLTPAMLVGERSNFEGLQARFQQFRWSYVREYRAAHKRWREDMKKLAAVVEDARRYFDALRRLDLIEALGAPAGEALAPLMAEMGKRIVQCDFEGPLAPEVSPRCPRCGFTLGAAAPKEELAELFKRIKDALDQKLAALSKSTIARLIREHDHAHRLEGLLKMTQAANLEVLVRVLDDDLAGYLGRLIDENLASAGEAVSGSGEAQSERAVIRRISERRAKSRGSKTRP